MRKPKTAGLILILSEKCDCYRLSKPLKGLFAQDHIETVHRFEGSEQCLLLDLPVGDKVLIRNRIRRFRRMNPECKMIDLEDFKTAGKKGKAWLITSGRVVEYFKLGLDLLSVLNSLKGRV